MPKKVPQRMCIACRQMKSKDDLCRIVKDSNGDIFIDETLKANGRGAYICQSMECLDKAVKSKALNRVFKCEVSQQVVQDLRDMLANKKIGV